MRSVILLRHGKSSWADSTLTDFDRPLAPRGKRASKHIATYMRKKGIRPTLVLCSPARRTRETLETIKPALGKACSIEFVPELYAASAHELLEQLQCVRDSIGAVMLIGHNPGLQQLARLLASRGTDLAKLEEKFPTGSLATLSVGSDSWGGLRPGDAKLVDYVVPRDLG